MTLMVIGLFVQWTFLIKNNILGFAFETPYLTWHH